MRVLLATLSIATSASSLQGANDQYVIIDLGTFGGFYGEARAINDRGIVTGTADDRLGTNLAYVWSQGEIVRLGTLGGDLNLGQDINAVGQVVGDASGNTFAAHAVLWSNGTAYDLGTLGGDRSEAHGINDAGLIVGESRFDPDIPHSKAVQWRNGVIEELELLPGHVFSEAWDVNERGFIVGRMRVDLNVIGVVWRHSEIVATLESLDFTVNPRAINDAGTITGHRDEPGAEDGAFIYRDDELTVIHDDILARNTWAYSINNQDEIVGLLEYYGGKGLTGGFYWRQDCGMLDLETQLPPQSTWDIVVAWDVNDAGQIVGRGTHGRRGTRAYLMSPMRSSLLLSPPLPGVSDSINSISVTGAEPGSVIYFGYGTAGGGTMLPTCDLLDAAVQIDAVTVAGSAVADDSGVASLTVYVPPRAVDLGGILIQAFDPANCQVSQLIIETFE